MTNTARPAVLATVALLLAAALLVGTAPRPAGADECDELAQAGGGGATAEQAIARLQAVLRDPASSAAMRNGATSGLAALQACVARRGAQPPVQPPVQPSVQPPVQPPVEPSEQPGPVRPQVQPSPGQPAQNAPTHLEPVPPVPQPAPEAPAAAPPGTVCANPAFVRGLAAAQEAYVARVRAAQAALVEAVRAAGGDRVALARAEAVYTKEVRAALGEAMQQARGAELTGAGGDAPAARALIVPGTDILARVGRAALESLGAQFARLCTPAPAAPPPAANEPAVPERAVSVWFNSNAETQVGQIRQAGASSFEASTGDRLAPGDTIRASHGQLRVDLAVASLDPAACGGFTQCFKQVGTIYIDRGSEVTFEKLPSGDPVVIVREGGRVYTKNVSSCAPHCVITETKARWFLPKGTAYDIEVAPDGAETLAVLEGSVEVRDVQTGASALVEASQRFAAEGGALDANGLRAHIAPLAAGSVERWWTPAPAPESPVMTEGTRTSRALRAAAVAGGAALALAACAGGAVVALRRRRA